MVMAHRAVITTVQLFARLGGKVIRGRVETDEDERPMLYTFSTCRDSIRTIPALQHDPRRMEDLDSSAEDHAADEWRYACMSRPYARPKPEAQERMSEGRRKATRRAGWRH